MEQLRLLIAIVLSFLVFLLYGVFFTAKEPIKESAETVTSGKEVKEKPFVQPIEGQAVNKAPVLEETPLEPERKAREITVNTSLYSARISEKGAVFNSLILRDYRETVDKNSPLKQVIPKDLDMGSVQIGFAGKSIPALEGSLFASDVTDDIMEITDKPETISFSMRSASGIVVEKKFVFSPKTYAIGLDVTIKNGSDKIFEDNLVLSLVNVLPANTGSYGFEGPSALIGNKLEQVKIEKIKDKNIYSGEIKWISIEDQYFMSSIVPEKNLPGEMRLFVQQNNILESQYVQKTSVIQPGTQQTYEYELFFGPKSMKVLSEVDYNLDKAINFGMFDFIAKPCLWFMNFIYGFIPNYGVAIIILTIVIKLILWPLGSKSYKSMNEMKKLQPLMAEIREKYKDDKKRMNQELMGLYKIYKINPMGGCLPMILQIPVFFALYRMLYQAIELRHAPFFGWINDLSAPDRLFNFNFTVPFMHPPSGIPVLTIIMGVTMFLQQKMTPTAGDPTQAKMMRLMPLFFTVIFINFSSGLVLYWLVNNILSILQQSYISKKMAQ